MSVIPPPADITLTSGQVAVGGTTANSIVGSSDFKFTTDSGTVGPTVEIAGNKPLLRLNDDTDATDYVAEFSQSGASLYLRHEGAVTAEWQRIQPGLAEFNRGGKDQDFVFYGETDGSTPIVLKMDAAEANVGIGTAPAAGVKLHVNSPDTSGENLIMRLQNSGPDSAADRIDIQSYWSSLEAGRLSWILEDVNTGSTSLSIYCNDDGTSKRMASFSGEYNSIDFAPDLSDGTRKFKISACGWVTTHGNCTLNSGDGDVANSNKFIIDAAGGDAVLHFQESTDGWCIKHRASDNRLVFQQTLTGDSRVSMDWDGSQTANMLVSGTLGARENIESLSGHTDLDRTGLHGQTYINDTGSAINLRLPLGGQVGDTCQIAESNGDIKVYLESSSDYINGVEGGDATRGIAFDYNHIVCYKVVGVVSYWLVSNA